MAREPRTFFMARTPTDQRKIGEFISTEIREVRGLNRFAAEFERVKEFCVAPEDMEIFEALCINLQLPQLPRIIGVKKVSLEVAGDICLVWDIREDKRIKMFKAVRSK